MSPSRIFTYLAAAVVGVALLSGGGESLTQWDRGTSTVLLVGDVAGSTSVSVAID